MIIENFSWKEMVESRIARERGIPNLPGSGEMAAMEQLARELLQPLRDLYGRPIRISSGYRCPELNRLVGGTAMSQHLKGEAADCVVEDAGELLKVLTESGLTYDQAILYRKRNFLHLSLRMDGKNRTRIILR